MKTRILFATFVCALIGTPVVLAADSDWQRVTLPAGKFEVVLPGTPVQQQQTQKTPLGVMDIRLMFAADQARGINYAVEVLELPPALKAQLVGNEAIALENFATGFLQGVQGKLVSKETLTIAGVPALEIRATIGDGQGELHARLCVIDGRVYVLAVMSPRGGADAEATARFFGSFQEITVQALPR